MQAIRFTLEWSNQARTERGITPTASSLKTHASRLRPVTLYVHVRLDDMITINYTGVIKIYVANNDGYILCIGVTLLKNVMHLNLRISDFKDRKVVYTLEEIKRQRLSSEPVCTTDFNLVDLLQIAVEFIVTVSGVVE